VFGLRFGFTGVATSIAFFVSFEVGAIDPLCRLGFLATVWLGALVALLWVEAVIYVASELGLPMKPRAGADEDIPSKPLRPVIARRRTVIRSDVIVTIGALRSYPDLNADLSLRFWKGCREADCSNRSYHQKSKSTHKLPPYISIFVISNFAILERFTVRVCSILGTFEVPKRESCIA
jgi:hypothetical protein